MIVWYLPMHGFSHDAHVNLQNKSKKARIEEEEEEDIIIIIGLL